MWWRDGEAGRAGAAGGVDQLADGVVDDYSLILEAGVDPLDQLARQDEAADAVGGLDEDPEGDVGLAELLEAEEGLDALDGMLGALDDVRRGGDRDPLDGGEVGVEADSAVDDDVHRRSRRIQVGDDAVDELGVGNDHGVVHHAPQLGAPPTHVGHVSGESALQLDIVALLQDVLGDDVGPGEEVVQAGLDGPGRRRGQRCRVRPAEGLWTPLGCRGRPARRWRRRRRGGCAWRCAAGCHRAGFRSSRPAAVRTR